MPKNRSTEYLSAPFFVVAQMILERTLAVHRLRVFVKRFRVMQQSPEVHFLLAGSKSRDAILRPAGGKEC